MSAAPALTLIAAARILRDPVPGGPLNSANEER